MCGMDQLLTCEVSPSWLPGGSVSTFLTSSLPAEVPVTAAFVFAHDAKGRLALCRVRARGWDLPGGHVELGEAPDETAARELAEEVGLELNASDLSLFGVQRVSTTVLRAGYPADAVFAFYAAFVADPPPLEPSLECDAAGWVFFARVAELAATRGWVALLEHVPSPLAAR